jgi:hypothetical protein
LKALAIFKNVPCHLLVLPRTFPAFGPISGICLTLIGCERKKREKESERKEGRKGGLL